MQFDYLQGEQDVYMCLARASGGVLDVPIVAQGMSMDSESEAKTEAVLNLIHSLEALGHSCS